MFRPRIIPVLLLHNGGLVKSIKFKDYIYVGDPMNAVKLFNDLRADELVFLDIDAGREGRTINVDLVREIGEEANMPFSVGGGIHSVEQIRSLIQAGAERVVIGSSAATHPGFVREAALIFGASTISVCIDVKKNIFGSEYIWSNNGRKMHKIHPVEFAQKMEDCGVGELIVQSISRDGTMSGFNVELIKQVSDAVSISIVGLGGGGTMAHFREVFERIPTSGIASGSKFVFQNKMRGVLINYPTLNEKRAVYE